MSSTRIGVCSDTHFWFGGKPFISKDGSRQLQDHSVTILDTLLRELEKADLDMAMHLGDFACGGGTYRMTHREFRRSQEQAHSAFSRLPVDFYALPGNHDSMPGGDWTFFEQLWNLRPGIGHTIDLPHARLVVLNAQGHAPAQLQATLPDDPVTGWVNDEELARLDQALATAGDRPVILFSHQLLRPWQAGKPWKFFYAVENAGDVLDRLAAHGNVCAVIQGHAHRLDVHTALLGARECTFVVLPSLTEFPLAWLRLEIDATHARLQLRPLPLSDLAETSRDSGDGQEWRAGRVEWHDFAIPLA